MTQKQYTLGEEIANSITHGVGAIFGIVALTLLMVFGAFYGDAWYIVSFAIYGASLIIMYTMSTLYHAFPSERVKAVFQILDHSAIYLLIAGTYTPFALVSLRQTSGWWMFGIIWGIAVAGIVVCTIPKTNHNKMISALVYLAMGWMIIFYWNPISAAVTKETLVWLIIGGIFYTFGAVFYICKKMPYSHPIWHLFVILGSIAHFIAIFYLLPIRG